MMSIEHIPGRPAYRLTFEIPGLPRRTNNNHGHWRTRHAEAMKWKNLVMFAVRKKGVLRPEKPLARAKLTLTRFSSSQPDFDGLVSSFKHVLDGLIEAGVLENDKMQNIGAPEYRWQKTKPGNGRIQIEIEEVVE